VNAQINGDAREVPEDSTVLSLVRSLGLEPGWVVVEHNLHALDRAVWERTPVREGDQIEIVRFMGGG
jgi:sulfur carrier protein